MDANTTSLFQMPDYDFCQSATFSETVTAGNTVERVYQLNASFEDCIGMQIVNAKNTSVETSVVVTSVDENKVLLDPAPLYIFFYTNGTRFSPLQNVIKTNIKAKGRYIKLRVTNPTAAPVDITFTVFLFLKAAK